MGGTRWRLWAVLAAAAFALGAAGTTAGVAKEKAWKVKPLPLREGWYGSYGNDVSDSGIVGGGWIDADGGMHAAWWYQGAGHDVASEIGMPEGFEEGNSSVSDVNENGLLGGLAWAGWDQVAALWDTKKGTVTNLHPGGDLLASSVTCVSDAGVVAGYIVVPADSPPYFAMRPYVWRKGGAEQVELPWGDYAEGTCNGVNARGDVAGMIFTRGDGARAVLWTDDDTFVDIGAELMDADGNVYWSQAFDVNDDGTVVGDAWTVTGSGEDLEFAWTWSEKDGVTILPQGGTLNAIAWEATGRYVAGGVGPYWGDESAAVWLDGKLDVLPHALDLFSMEAGSVNSRGLVAGYGFTEDDASTHWYPQGWTAEKE